MTTSELGQFLVSRRSALCPEDVGITAHPTRRRVTGLRREEVAALANISVTHYTRLEQGRITTASDGMLAAIARALQLTADETAHLVHLARPNAHTSPTQSEPAVSTSTRQLLATMTTIPAVVMNRRNDVLAWNPMGHKLLASHLPCDVDTVGGGEEPNSRPNLTAMLFLDDHYRSLYVDVNEQAQLAVAALRLTAGEHPADQSLAQLVGHLAMNSDEFARLWAQHPVQTCTSGIKDLRHPVVGEFAVSFENLVIPGTGGQRLITYTAVPGSAAAHALQRLERADIAQTRAR